MKKFILAFALASFVLIGCNIAPEPVNYGSDTCHFCSMTIVDRQHAAQYVTKKGKAFKFDASECMLNQLKEIDIDEVALFLVNDYNSPEELIDATNATYLISKNIPSPMGEFLTAFGGKEEAEKTRSEQGGDLFSWEELEHRFIQKNQEP